MCLLAKWTGGKVILWESGLADRAHVLIRDKHTWNADISAHHWLIYVNPPHPSQEHCKQYA